MQQVIVVHGIKDYTQLMNRGGPSHVREAVVRRSQILWTEMDGREACRLLRQQSRLPKVIYDLAGTKAVVVAVSADDAFELKAAAVARTVRAQPRVSPLQR